MENRTYKYMEAEPLFPFGFGLSYNQYEYGPLRASDSVIKKGGTINVSLELKNTGTQRGEEVVQLYIRDDAASFRVPYHSLRAFQRVSLYPGESKLISFSLNSSDFESVNEAGESVLEPGSFTISVGSSQPIQRSTALGAPLYRQLSLIHR